jgi:hypothetical protein
MTEDPGIYFGKSFAEQRLIVGIIVRQQKCDINSIGLRHSVVATLIAAKLTNIARLSIKITQVSIPG